MRQTVLAAAAAFAVASGAMTMQASAADLDFMAPPPPPFVPTWQGFYVGGHVGYGEADFDADAFRRRDFVEGGFNEAFFDTSLSPDGLLGGIQGGYNWQMNSLVFGIEGDISFTDWSESAVLFDDFNPQQQNRVGTVSTEVDLLASVRGRLGFAMQDLMIYGTGGVAWADAEAKGRFDVDGVTVASGKESFNDVGFVVGGGASWMVIPQTFSVGVEGLYYFFDQDETLYDQEVVAPNGDLVTRRATASLDDAWVIRARGDFHF